MLPNTPVDPLAIQKQLAILSQLRHLVKAPEPKAQPYALS